ncbi:hypothetical protein NL676_001010 [Syzygium grande]|nr:hypothetical protein NL676_001010 [Syzygium grande]
MELYKVETEVVVEVTIIIKAMTEAVAATSTITSTTTTEARMEAGTAATADNKASAVTVDTHDSGGRIYRRWGGFNEGGHHPRWRRQF